MADKALNSVATDTSFDYFLGVKGTEVKKMTKEQVATVVGGLIGTATTEKDGLMSSKDKKSILEGHNVGNKTFIKILSSNTDWQRKSALIYGDYNGVPYMVLLGMYTQLPSTVFYVKWITEKVNMLRFYKKGNSINAFFDLSPGAPHNAFIQSIEGIEFISIGVEPSSEYTEITT